MFDYDVITAVPGDFLAWYVRHQNHVDPTYSYAITDIYERKPHYLRRVSRDPNKGPAILTPIVQRPTPTTVRYRHVLGNLPYDLATLAASVTPVTETPDGFRLEPRLVVRWAASIDDRDRALERRAILGAVLQTAAAEIVAGLPDTIGPCGLGIARPSPLFGVASDDTPDSIADKDQQLRDFLADGEVIADEFEIASEVGKHLFRVRVTVARI